MAAPPESVTWPPKLVPSTRNWTEPSGVPPPLPAGAMWAVKLTAWPETDGLADDETVVAEPDWPTAWVADAVLETKLGSPV